MPQPVPDWSNLYGGANGILPYRATYRRVAQGWNKAGVPWLVVELVGQRQPMHLVQGADVYRIANWVNGWHDDGRCEHHQYGLYRCHGLIVGDGYVGLCPTCKALGITMPAKRTGR